MDFSTTIKIAVEELQDPLAARGYLMVTEPPVVTNAFWFFWFERIPATLDDVFRIVEFQVTGLDEDHVFEMAVNLARRPFRDFHDPRNYEGKSRTFNVRLASCLWETQAEKRSMHQSWHFDDSLDKIHAAYKDILDRLLNYGIPFLEDPTSSWWTYSSQKPPE